MSNDKTPGSNCSLKEDFEGMANHCLSAAEIPGSLREAFISLLFKKDDPELLKNRRPILILNVVCKIQTKILVKSAKSLMSTSIHPQWRS